MAALVDNEATAPKAGDEGGDGGGETAVESAPTSAAAGSNEASSGGESKAGSSSVDFEMPSPDEHLLQNKYTFWYMKRGNKSAAAQAESYEQSIKQISHFASIEQFWAVYSHIQRPGDAGTEKPMDYIMFRRGIKPMWEDENNKKGGKWVVRIPKRLSAYYWESLLLAIIGEQFDVADEICGLVLSVRFSEDVLSIWNRNSTDLAVLAKIRDIMRRVLKLPGNVQMDYRPHDTSMPRPEIDGGATATTGAGWSAPMGAGGNNNGRPARGGNNGGGRRDGGGRYNNRNNLGGSRSQAPQGRWR